MKAPEFPANEAWRRQLLASLTLPEAAAIGERFGRVTRLADAGLDRAKETGRNRVISPLENGG